MHCLSEKSPPEIQMFADLTTMARNLIDRVTAPSVKTVAWCGGSTPVRLFQCVHTTLTTDSTVRAALANCKHLFTDERCVGPEHERSNYAMLKRELFDRAGIPESQILRILGEDDPDKAADAYENELLYAIGSEPVPLGEPYPAYSLDLMILGIGLDGHTASLFPGESTLAVDDCWVCAAKNPELGEARVTLTYPCINAARRLVVIATGADKAAIVRRFADRDPNLPISRVFTKTERVVLMVDEPAAADLQQEALR